LTDLDLEYLPVGAGSYHWRAGRRFFITVDDLDNKHYLGNHPDAVYERQRSAIKTAHVLRQRGLEFVVGPVPAIDGTVLHRISRRYALAVYPFLGDPKPFRKTLSEPERYALRGMLSRLHAARYEHAMAVPIEVPLRPQLERSLSSRSAPPLLQQNAATIRAWLLRFDELVGVLTERKVEMVITHGEPHSGNIVRTSSGFMLVDWDTAGLAPRERDLWLVGGGDPMLCELFRLRWRLDDISWAASALNAEPELALRALQDSIDHEPFTRD
jgi:hypothetical protein